MSSIIRTLNQRRVSARNQRHMWRIINSAGSPAMRDELIVMHQRQIGEMR